MDSQQSDPSQLIPEIPLNPAENISINPLAPQDFQEESSQIQKRMLISDRQSQISSHSPAQNSQSTKNSLEEKSRLKELDSSFGKFYQVAMAINIIAAAWNFITMIVLLAKGSVLDPSFLLFVGLALAQFLLAFSGMRSRNLGRIEKALRLMEVYLGILGLRTVIDCYPGRLQGNEYASFSTENFLRSMAVIGIHITINILPTIRVKNILKEEEKVQNGEKPWSWYLRIYQVWVLLYFFQTAVKVILFVFREFDGVQETLKFMRSNNVYLYSILLLVFLGPLKLQTFYLLFQGMRKKNLKSIFTAMKLIAISLAIGVGLNVLRYVALSQAGRVGKLGRDFSDVVYEGLGEFVYEEVVSRFALASALIYGAWQVCDVLKGLQKVKQAE